jgi:hypothetical protein
LSCKLWKTLHFWKWTSVLSVVNTCTSCSHTSLLPSRWFHNVSSIFTWNMHFQNWKFVSSLCVLSKLNICTYFPLHDIIIFLALDMKVNFRNFIFVLPDIIAYTHSHSFVLPLDDFIIFIELHMKVHFRNWIFVLLVIIMCTSRSHWLYLINFFEWFHNFCNSFAGTRHFPNVNLYTSRWHNVYFPSSSCVLSKVKPPYFSSSSGILLIVFVCTFWNRSSALLINRICASCILFVY